MRQAHPRVSITPATVEIGRGRGISEAASERADVAFVDGGEHVGRWDRFVHQGSKEGSGGYGIWRRSCGQLAGDLESQALR
jgi:hypothetical protein